MTRRALLLLTAGLVGLVACTGAPSAGTAVTQPPPRSTDVAVQATRAVDGRAVPVASRSTTNRAAIAPLPGMIVHKSPSCGCCGKWVEHMRGAGFAVEVNHTDDLEPIKKRLGVPLGKGSCHTTEVGRLVIEGHVPAEDIKRLLAANDGSRGLVLPGMPAGSPGMEMPNGRVQRFTVEKINADGSTTPFATHGEQ